MPPSNNCIYNYSTIIPKFATQIFNVRNYKSAPKELLQINFSFQKNKYVSSTIGPCRAIAINFQNFTSWLLAGAWGEGKRRGRILLGGVRKWIDIPITLILVYNTCLMAFRIKREILPFVPKCYFYNSSIILVMFSHAFSQVSHYLSSTLSDLISRSQIVLFSHIFQFQWWTNFHNIIFHKENYGKY